MKHTELGMSAIRKKLRLPSGEFLGAHPAISVLLTRRLSWKYTHGMHEIFVGVNVFADGNCHQVFTRWSCRR